MKKKIGYISCLVLWELYIIDKWIDNIIGIPFKYFYAFLYDRSAQMRKHYIKLGFNSSKEIIDNFDDYSYRLGKPISSFYVGVHHYALFFFIIHGTILFVSHVIFNSDIPRNIPKPYDWYILVALIIISGIIPLYYECSGIQKKHFRQFDKWGKKKRKEMQWKAFGIIVFCWVYNILAMWLFL